MKLTPVEKQFLLAAMEREANRVRDCIVEFERKTGKVHILSPDYYHLVAKDINLKLKLS